MVCGMDVSWLLEEGGVVVTPAMQAEVAMQRGLLGLEKGEQVDDDWLKEPANRSRPVAPCDSAVTPPRCVRSPVRACQDMQCLNPRLASSRLVRAFSTLLCRHKCSSRTGGRENLLRRAPKRHKCLLSFAHSSQTHKCLTHKRPQAPKPFLEALNAAHHPLALYPPHQIRTDSFSQAFFDYLRAIDRILSMPSLNAQTYRPNSPEEHSVTVPSVRSSQCSMRTVEQFVYYLLAVALLLRQCCGMLHMLHLYIDFACQFQIGIGKGQAPTRLPSISLSADMAQLQLRVLRGPHKQRVAAAKLKCMELETAHGVHALEKEKHHGSAEGESPLIARGLKVCVAWQGYRTQVEQLTNDVHELMLQRDRMDQSDKDPCAASNAIKAKRKKARQLLREAALYQALGSGEYAAAVSMTEEQLQAMVRGEPAPWAEASTAPPYGKLLHYGRQLHHLQSDRDRGVGIMYDEDTRLMTTTVFFITS
ncbi:hypothetical protein QJQ45_025070 [Haematococcus lacustris]|nr:hypothetical protein QJQ45_025070 [Haematococcus lacustris]